MNERIKELAKEAGMIYGQGNLDDFDMLTYMPKEVRFAEMIVADCASQLVQANMSNPAYAQAMDEYYENKWAHRFD